MKNPHLITGALCAVSMAAGAGAAYFVAKKQLETKYDELVQKEIEEAKDFYRKLYYQEKKLHEGPSVDELIPPSPDNEFTENPSATSAANVLKVYGGDAVSRKPDLDVLTRGRIKVEETVVSKNVFIEAELSEQGFTDQDWKNELLSRTEEAPYVISEEEYMENETDYTQVTMTYYAGDGVLTDDEDRVIETIDEVIGDNNLIRFGHWSNDPRIVYIRNDVRELESEVILNDGKYSEVVQGFSEVN